MVIENKDLGLKFAVNKDEAYYIELKEKLEKDNSSMVKTIEINKVVIEFCANKLKSKKW